MAFMGPLLASVGKGAVKGLGKGAVAGARNLGQSAKSNLKQLGPKPQPGGQQQQKQPRRSPLMPAPPTFAESKATAPDIIASMKHGGQVRKDGIYMLHKDEHVVPAGKKTRIIAAQAREPVPTGKHRRHKQVTKIVGSQVAKR